jgi:hypothetical protein
VAQLTLPLAVEKAMFRLALREAGVVPIARLFLELPLSIEEVEQYADRVADGQAVVKNEWGEFLCYEFPELMRQSLQAPDDCPTCGGDSPAAPTEGGAEVRGPLLCDACYRQLKLQATAAPDEGTLEKIKGVFFRQGESDSPADVARLEHEIFYLALRTGVDQFTHTSLAAQSRHPAVKLKDRLDRMAARRYLHVGLLPSGDTVGYRLPGGLTYPRSHYQRISGAGGPPPTGPLGGRIKGLKTEPTGHRPAPPPPPPPRPNPLKIVIKDRRQRPG